MYGSLKPTAVAAAKEGLNGSNAAPSCNNDITTSPSSSSSNDEKEQEGSDSTTAFLLPCDTPPHAVQQQMHSLNANLHTHPLAVNYFCQTCFQITSMLKREDGDDLEEEKTRVSRTMLARRLDATQ